MIRSRSQSGSNRINVYITETLKKELEGVEINMSEVFQVAIRAAVAAVKTNEPQTIVLQPNFKPKVVALYKEVQD
jgi:post-segregation antitoxin (ccd killing protein)